MIDQQKPLASGFGAKTTTRDVLAGIDLSGKHAIVTGGHPVLAFKRRRRSPKPARR